MKFIINCYRPEHTQSRGVSSRFLNTPGLACHTEAFFAVFISIQAHDELLVKTEILFLSSSGMWSRA